jgi:hypothetical protein
MPVIAQFTSGADSRLDHASFHKFDPLIRKQ